MKYDYIFYTTDGSFDYGDFPGGTYHCLDYHGFSIDMDERDWIDIASLEAYGDYCEMEDKCKSLEELKIYLINHLHEVREYEEHKEYSFTNLEIFKELIDLINDCLREEWMKKGGHNG